MLVAGAKNRWVVGASSVLDLAVSLMMTGCMFSS